MEKKPGKRKDDGWSPEAKYRYGLHGLYLFERIAQAHREGRLKPVRVVEPVRGELRVAPTKKLP